MSYFSNIFEYPQEVIDTVCHALKDPKFGTIDLIVGTGMSGAIVLLPISLQSGIPFCIVRKGIDSNSPSIEGGCHSCCSIETKNYITGKEKILNFVIIDDFISSGGTVKRVIRKITNKCENAKCVGIVLYQTGITTVPTHDGARNTGLDVIPISAVNEDIIELERIKLQSVL